MSTVFFYIGSGGKLQIQTNSERETEAILRKLREQGVSVDVELSSMCG